MNHVTISTNGINYRDLRNRKSSLYSNSWRWWHVLNHILLNTCLERLNALLELLSVWLEGRSVLLQGLDIITIGQLIVIRAIYRLKSCWLDGSSNIVCIKRGFCIVRIYLLGSEHCILLKVEFTQVNSLYSLEASLNFFKCSSVSEIGRRLMESLAIVWIQQVISISPHPVWHFIIFMKFPHN